MVEQITPVVAGAYCLVSLFYSSMACLGGQGRPLPVATENAWGGSKAAPASEAARSGAGETGLARRPRARRLGRVGVGKVGERLARVALVAHLPYMVTMPMWCQAVSGHCALVACTTIWADVSRGGAPPHSRHGL